MSKTPHAPTIAILGGGVGGTVLANLLSRELNEEEAHIVLIDKSGHHIYQPGWLYLPFNGQSPDHLERAERNLLRHRVELLIGEAQEIDLAQHKLHLASAVERSEIGTVHYDYLVFASGARVVPEDLTGLSEALEAKAAHHFYTQRGAEHLRQAISEFRGGRVAVAIGGIPYKCPPAPLEFTFLLEDYLRQRGLRSRTEIAYYSPLPRAFTIESVSEMVTPLLEERGIHSRIFFNLEEIDPHKRVIRSLEGEEEPYDLLVVVPPHRGALIAEHAGSEGARAPVRAR
jgi:sulfide:quinone oxidoreductase